MMLGQSLEWSNPIPKDEFRVSLYNDSNEVIILEPAGRKIVAGMELYISGPPRQLGPGC